MNKRLKILLSILAVSLSVFFINSIYFSGFGFPNFVTDPIKQFVGELNQRSEFTTSTQSQSNVEIYRSGEPASRQVTPPPPQPRQTRSEIGQTFTLKDFKLTVTSATDLGSRLQFPYYSPSQTTGTFIEVKVHVENIGRTSSNLLTMGLVDSERRQFSYDLLLMSFDSEYRRYTEFDHVKPGFTSKRIAIFEVSAKSSGLSLVFADSEGKIIHRVPLKI